MQLKGAKKNYPVHEKELLAIMCTLKKWHSDLLSSPIFVYTDHHTLENFNTQCDLSQQQLCWQELMSQYDMEINYIHGEDITVADVLSHMAPNVFLGEQTDLDPHTLWSSSCMMLSIEADMQVLHDIKLSYEQDSFCKQLPNSNMILQILQMQMGYAILALAWSFHVSATSVKTSSNSLMTPLPILVPTNLMVPSTVMWQVGSYL